MPRITDLIFSMFGEFLWFGSPSLKSFHSYYHACSKIKYGCHRNKPWPGSCTRNYCLSNLATLFRRKEWFKLKVVQIVRAFLISGNAQGWGPHPDLQELHVAQQAPLQGKDRLGRRMRHRYLDCPSSVPWLVIWLDNALLRGRGHVA